MARDREPSVGLEFKCRARSIAKQLERDMEEKTMRRGPATAARSNNRKPIGKHSKSTSLVDRLSRNSLRLTVKSQPRAEAGLPSRTKMVNARRPERPSETAGLRRDTFI